MMKHFKIHKKNIKKPCPSGWRDPRNGSRFLGPGVARVPAHELLAQFGIRPLPEAGEVLGDLNGSVIGSEQVQGERNPAGEDLRALLEADEVLEPRLDPRLVPETILDPGATRPGESH